MCGIVGVAQYKSEIDREIRSKALKILFSDTLLRTEPRGRDATGLYQVQRCGEWAMTKKGVTVSKWLYLQREKDSEDFVYSDFMDSWDHHPQEISALVGHCRAGTVGSKTDPDNNHPFAVMLDTTNALLGVHNGTLRNHEIIFDKLPKGLKRHGKVDSEAIFHFLFHLTEQGTKPIDKEVLTELGQRVDGSYAVVAVNSRFPNQIVTFRDGRPMEMFLIKPLNIVLLASDKKYVEGALEKYNFYREMVEPSLPKLEYDSRALAERDYRIFHTDRVVPEGKPDWKSWDDISDKAEFKSFSCKIKKGWEDPKAVTTTSNSNYRRGGSYHTGAGGSTGQQSSAARVTKPTTTTPTIPATTGSKASTTAPLANVGAGEKREAQEAFTTAKSLGLHVHYKDVKEMLTAIGLTEERAKSAEWHEIANPLAKLNFCMGYALGRVDSKDELEGIKSKSREQTGRLEKAVDKHKRAQDRIWDYKTVIQIVTALAKGDYEIDAKNVGIGVGHMANLSEARIQGVKDAASMVLNSLESENLITSLLSGFKKKTSKEKNNKNVSQEN